MNEKYLEEANLTDKKELLEYATIAVLRNAKTDIPVLRDWANYSVRNEPLTIYDINGKPLFHDFTVQQGKITMGTIRTGASKILGAPVIACEIGGRFWTEGLSNQISALSLKVRNKYPQSSILSTKIVCYSYPKLGIMFEMLDARKKQSKLIFDVADNSQIPIKESFDNFEGAFAWSFYDKLSEEVRKKQLSNFNATNELRLKVPERTRFQFRTVRKLSSYLNVNEIAEITKIKLIQTKLLQFCNHYGHTESRSHHCFVLHAQQVNDYCAVATCQMILCYYRYYYSQNDIAPALNYSSGGGCPSDQSPGYESLSNNHIDATFDNSPTWEKARDQINALHPFKSGISGHARACAGYSYPIFTFGTTQGKKLYIYDPWPWNADYKLGGAVYWEDWDSITHTNYVTTSLRYP